MKLKRQSGVELLRIVAMLMVMVHHANYWRIGRPSSFECQYMSVASCTRIALQAFSDPCVDVFIIIAGYFAIRPKWRSIANLYFLLSFWSIMSYVFCSGGGWLGVVFPFWGWFVPAYLGLYLIAPILNAYSENTDESSLRKYLIFFFLIQYFFDHVYLGGLIFGRSIFNGGRSILSFSFLYLLGRYIRKRDTYFRALNNRLCWLGYILTFALSTLLQYCWIRWGSGSGIPFSGTIQRLIKGIGNNSSLFTVFGSFSLFLIFMKMTFENRFVNWVAASVLAVLCFHSFPFYEKMVKHIFYNHDGFAVVLLDGFFILIVFFGGVILDQIRVGAFYVVDKIILPKIWKR